MQVHRQLDRNDQPHAMETFYTKTNDEAYNK